MAGKGDRAWCPSCGFRAQRRRGRLFATAPGGEPTRTDAQTLADAAALGSELDKDFRCSAQAMACWRIREDPVWRRGELRGWVETMGPASPATVTVDDEAVAIKCVAAPRDGSSGCNSGRCRSGRWSHLELRAVQTSSSSLQISLPDDRLVQLRFTADSPKRWEDMLRQLVRAAYQRAGKGFVHEFQPRIATRPQ